jgi:hypothetical protein
MSVGLLSIKLLQSPTHEQAAGLCLSRHREPNLALSEKADCAAVGCDPAGHCDCDPHCCIPNLHCQLAGQVVIHLPGVLAQRLHWGFSKHSIVTKPGDTKGGFGTALLTQAGECVSLCTNGATSVMGILCTTY